MTAWYSISLKKKPKNHNKQNITTIQSFVEVRLENNFNRCCWIAALSRVTCFLDNIRGLKFVKTYVLDINWFNRPMQPHLNPISHNLCSY